MAELDRPTEESHHDEKSYSYLVGVVLFLHNLLFRELLLRCALKSR